jgi:hypothetical protein
MDNCQWHLRLLILATMLQRQLRRAQTTQKLPVTFYSKHPVVMNI